MDRGAGETSDDVRSKLEADHRNTWGYWEMMLNAPFLELAYFVGEANLKQAIDKVRAETPLEGAGQKFRAPNVIGIAGPVEQLAVRGWNCAPKARPFAESRVASNREFGHWAILRTAGSFTLQVFLTPCMAQYSWSIPWRTRMSFVEIRAVLPFKIFIWQSGH